MNLKELRMSLDYLSAEKKLNRKQCGLLLDTVRLLDEIDVFETTDRLRELVKADAEGRVVVLPCKVGDLIYDIRGDWETGKRLLVPHRVRSVYTEQKDGGTVEWEMYVSDFAFRVTKNTRMYFTKDEAERALAATEPKGDAET